MLVCEKLPQGYLKLGFSDDSVRIEENLISVIFHFFKFRFYYLLYHFTYSLRPFILLMYKKFIYICIITLHYIPKNYFMAEILA